MKKNKFRIWDRLSESFTRNLSITCDGNLTDIDESYQSNYIIQQCTGLKDNTGKEIYEGDIISYGSMEKEELFEVIWDDGGACFLLESPGGYGDWLSDVKNRKIVGNVIQKHGVFNK